MPFTMRRSGSGCDGSLIHYLSFPDFKYSGFGYNWVQLWSKQMEACNHRRIAPMLIWCLWRRKCQALEPLSLKLSATDNSFGILNDPFERETKSFVYELNDLALILSYEYHEMTELYPHRCQYKINRVDGIGAHNCMLAETDHFQLHYPYKIECKHITETKFWKRKNAKN